MIEDLEAEAVSQMVNGEQGRACSRVSYEHEGVTVEVRARRRSDGTAVVGYSFNGVRLERAVLLMLICPVAACERSQSVRRQWAARNPPAPALQRRPRTGFKSAEGMVGTPLFEEVVVGGSEGVYVARPASFTVVTACPVGAHQPLEMRMEGWDIFKDGKYLAGGLIVETASKASKPRFQTVESAVAWANRSPD